MNSDPSTGSRSLCCLMMTLLLLLPACTQTPEHHFDTVEQLINDYEPPTDDDGFTPIPEELLDFELPDKKPYRIGEGDIVVVQIIHTAPVPGYDAGVQVEVKEDGTIRLPILGRFEARDKTILELEEALTKPIQEDFVREAVVSITVTRFAARKYFVVGEVANPGTLPANGKTTLMQALISVGGTNKDTADLDEAYVIRDQEPVPFSIRDIVMRGHPAGRLVLEENDIVFVPHVRDRDDFVYIFGEVGSAQRIPMEHEGRRGMAGTLTLDAALALAGGLNQRGDVNDITIYRGGWKAPTRFKIGVQDLYQFGGNIQLKPGDRIAVGTSSQADFNDAMQPVLSLISTSTSALSLALSAVALGRTN